MGEAASILHLTLIRRWFDAMLNNNKPFEYREAKGYWITRLVARNADKNPEEWVCREYDLVKFVNGGHMGDVFPSITRALIKIHVYDFDRFDVDNLLYPRNGEELKHGKYYFAIELGDIVKRWKC